ncbi:MAG: VOC family protein [Pseudomonadota bacterium]
MHPNLDGFHHLGLISSAFSATIERYECLGFAFTPLSLPEFAMHPGETPQPVGVGNRTAIFRGHYLEVLGIFDRARWAAFPLESRGPYDLDQPLSRYEGMHVMHFGTDDLDAVRERLLRQGTPCSEIKPYQREVDTPNGFCKMRARVMHFPSGADPEGLLQIAQHLTPELVLQPRFMHHGNGAIAITEAIVCATDPVAIVAKYERYTGHASRIAGKLHIVDMGHSRIVVATPDDIPEAVPGYVPSVVPSLVGFTVATSSLDTAADVLERARIPYAEHRGRLVVSGKEASGSAVVFEPEGANR